MRSGEVTSLGLGKSLKCRGTSSVTVSGDDAIIGGPMSLRGMGGMIMGLGSMGGGTGMDLGSMGLGSMGGVRVWVWGLWVWVL